MKVKYIHIVDDNAESVLTTAIRCFFLSQDNLVEVSILSLVETEHIAQYPNSLIVFISDADYFASIADTIGKLRLDSVELPILILDRQVMNANNIKKISVFKNIGVASMNCASIDLLELIDKLCQFPKQIVMCLATQESLIKHVLDDAKIEVNKIKFSDLEQLILIAHEEGLSIKQTAEKLQISPNTVAAYRSKMLKRAGVTSMIKLTAHRQE